MDEVKLPSEVADEEAISYLVDWLKLTENQIDAIIEQGYANNAYDLMTKAIQTCQAFNYTPEEYAKNLAETYPRAFSTIRPKDFTDASNAEVLSNAYYNKMRYNPVYGWMVFTGKKWESSEPKAMKLAIMFADKMNNDATKNYRQARKDAEKAAEKKNADITKVKVPDDAIKYCNHALKTKSKASISNMMTLAQAYMEIEASKFDANPYYLNTIDGVYDLRTGEKLFHDPKFLCTKICPYVPDDTNGKELWESFLDLITCGDDSIRKYLQMCAGMNAIGRITEEFVQFAIGEGHNGKSTYYNAIGKVMGDYFGTISSTTLTVKDQNRKNTYAAIRGKRYVLCGELEEGAKLSTQALKELASTDNITIEKKYHDEETVTPMHHLVMFSNWLPRIPSNDNGTWRRIRVVPFNAKVPDGEQKISDYGLYLAENAGGYILHWIIEGAKMFYENGERLKVPEVVKKATAEYRETQNWINQFISDCCVVGDDVKVRAGDLYERYKKYCRDNGDYLRNRADFNKALLQKKFKTRTEAQNKTYWYGIGIEEREQEEQQPMSSWYEK